jgi:type I restriction enzyme S subunit
VNADRLFALYDRVADAPDAVDRLRRFVLDLAVRGKLVEQDLDATPVASLLPNPRTRVSDSQLFGIPASWAWVSVGSVAQSRLGKMLDKSKNTGNPRRYLRNVNVRWFDFDLSDVLEMRFEDAELPEFSLQMGDVLICEGGEPGRAAVWDEREDDIYFQKAIHRVRFLDIVDGRYFVNALRASANDGRLAEYFTGATIKHFTGTALRAYLFPLPPLAEQYRIVAKVDELMAFCDRLEEWRATREDTRNRLTKACYARLSAADTAAPTLRSHARFAVDALPVLTARADQVKQLQQTILELAVRGRLVDQDPADEPASELLKRVSEERKTLVQAKQIKRVKVDPNALGETPFRVPSNWEWTWLGNIGDWGAGSTPSRANTDFFGGDVTWIKSGELNDDRHLLGSEETITQLALDSCSFRMNRPGDVLIAMYGATIGKLAILAELAVTNQAVCGCTPFQGVLSDFLFFFLLSQRSRFRRSSEGGAQPNISKVKIVATPFPLPPFAEQHRIVAKVDELMVLCGRLETGLDATDDTRNRLFESLLQDTLAPSVCEAATAGVVWA